MSAKRLPVEEGIRMLLGDGVNYRLLERYLRYTEEAEALRKKLKVSNVRKETRLARLEMLETVLMPQLQLRITGYYF